jgi:hypothetical protein
MAAPSSAIFSETYLQYIGHNHIIDLLIKHQIISYHRYVDDMFYNTHHTNIDSALTDFNNILRKIQFSVEEECNRQINFLDLLIIRTCNKLEFGIFRKPTATDIMIHNRSCHPIEHKLSGIIYLINRITSCPITKNNTIKEEQTMNHLLKVNGYQYTNTKTLIKHKQLHKRKQHRTEKQCAIFTYTWKDTRYITKLFKGFNVNISYCTRNTIGNILSTKIQNNSPYEECGIYQLNVKIAQKYT